MKYCTAIIFIFLISQAYAQSMTVGQKNKAFVVDGKPPSTSQPLEVSIKQGETVRFINNDDFFHNVFSLSDAKLFDLGSFPQGEYRDVTFEEKGDVEVECAIHPDMKMVIHVE